MRYFKYLILFFPALLIGQSETGYYINWNNDHTGQSIKPTIKISEEESRIINCYFVEFDEEENFKSVKYFNSGKPSSNTNFGAHERIRKHTKHGYQYEFKNVSGVSTVNSNGIKYYSFKVDSNGHWIEKGNIDDDGNLVEENGISLIKVTRDSHNRILTEIRYNIKNDTIPDVNDFRIVHLTYDHNNYTTSRQNRDEEGKLINAKYGYAKVVFQFDQNGMFYGEEFLNADKKLTSHPNFGFAKIDFRDFNKYGKNYREYYSDESGYPCSDISMGKIIYNSNMSMQEISFFNRIGERSEDNRGFSKIRFVYDSNGNILKRMNYNVNDELSSKQYLTLYMFAYPPQAETTIYRYRQTVQILLC